MTRWLVTGGSGFLGRHLLQAIDVAAPIGTRAFAAGRSRPPGWPVDQYVAMDLTQEAELHAGLEALRPEVVFHLAGATPPCSSTRMFDVNTRGTINLISALRATGRKSRVVVMGSAAELGPVPLHLLPISESCVCRPEGAYGLSKWFASAYALRCGPPLEVIVARAFNPIGPGLGPHQAFGRFARLLAQEPGPAPVRLVVGDLDARRDFVDARDLAGGLLALAERGQPGLVYHLGSGESVPIRSGLEHLIARSGRRVEVVERAARPGGPSDSRADVRRARDQIGWRPETSWRQSLDDLWSELIAGRHQAVA